MDELVDDHVTYHDHDRAFHDTIMQASGNRIARGVVRALESQVINTARYMGRTERALCVASNQGHRRIYERIAAHDSGRRRRGDVHPHHRGLAGPPQRLGQAGTSSTLKGGSSNAEGGGACSRDLGAGATADVSAGLAGDRDQENCAKNLQISPLVQVVMPLSA